MTERKIIVIMVCIFFMLCNKRFDQEFISYDGFDYLFADGSVNTNDANKRISAVRSVQACVDRTLKPVSFAEVIIVYQRAPFYYKWRLAERVIQEREDFWPK